MYIGQGSQLMAGLGSGEQNGVILFPPCVHRLEVTPAYLDQSMAASPMTTPCRWNDTRQDKQLYFPLMTYWPIDL